MARCYSGRCDKKKALCSLDVTETSVMQHIFLFQEELEDIRLDLESEQKSLVSEHARQNRIAATVSSEMFAECQVRAGWLTLV